MINTVEPGKYIGQICLKDYTVYLNYYGFNNLIILLISPFFKRHLYKSCSGVCIIHESFIVNINTHNTLCIYVNPRVFG